MNYWISVKLDWKLFYFLKAVYCTNKYLTIICLLGYSFYKYIYIVCVYIYIYIYKHDVIFSSVCICLYICMYLLNPMFVCVCVSVYV